jgi:hypothetical protein
MIVVTAGACGSGGDAAVTVASHCAPINALSFPPALVGQTASVFVIVSNDTSANGRVSIGLDGTDREQFSFDSQCLETVVAGASCTVLVQVTPTSAGDKHAVLHLGATAIPLDVTASDPPPGLFVDVANLAFFGLGSASFTVGNRGGPRVTLAPKQTIISDDFAVDLAYTCGFMQLDPGAVCGTTVSFAQSSTDCIDTAARIVTDMGTIEIPVTSQFVASASVSVTSKVGGGLGTVTSDPPGISCTADGPFCSSQIVGDSVTLTATPAPGHFFNGWLDPACSFDPHCTLPLQPPFGTRNVTADFAPPDSRAITVMFAGDGTGNVLFNGKRCDASCTIYVADGDVVSLEADPTSGFGGWSGCAQTETACQLGMIVDDRTVTVTFTKDPHAHSTTWITQPLTLAAPISGGDLVFATFLSDLPLSLITRVSPSGATVWTRGVAGRVARVTTTPSGAIYVMTDIALTQLTPDGHKTWSVVPTLVGAEQIAAVGEDIAIGGDAGLALLAAADGTSRWSSPTLTRGIAAGPGGIIATIGVGTITRFANDGTQLTPTWTAPTSTPTQLVYDAAGNLVVNTDAIYDSGTIMTHAKQSRFSPTGTIDFAVDLDPSESTGGGQAVVTGDKIVMLRSHWQYPMESVGAYLEAYDGTGALVWRLDRWGQLVALESEGFVSGILAAFRDGTVTLVGRDATRGGFLETFTP